MTTRVWLFNRSGQKRLIPQYDLQQYKERYMTTAKRQIPDGMMEDAQGRHVAIEKIRPIDLERNALVNDIIANAGELVDTIAAFKSKTMADIDAFVELSAEQYNAKLGGRIGNVTLTSFDGQYKIVRAIDERQTFDERLQAAKALLDEYLVELTADSNADIRTLINDVFQVDKQGNINVNRILGLRRLNITDERWRNAMLAIGESLQVVDTKAYLRIYERQADGKYELLPLNVAA